MTATNDTRSGDEMPGERLETQYREHRGDGPPDALDQAVLARAHRALARERDVDRNRRDWRASRGAWLTGVATASVALLALAVVLQQAVPPAVEPDPEALFAPAWPAAAPAPDRQAGSADQEQMLNNAAAPADADLSEPRAPESVQMRDLMRRTRPAREVPPPGPAAAEAVAPLEEAAGARRSEAESRLQAPDADFELPAPAQFKSIAAESDETYVNAGDPTQDLKVARRALFIGVRVALARGDDAAARAAIEDHRAVDPDLRLPDDLATRLSIESGSEPD